MPKTDQTILPILAWATFAHGARNNVYSEVVTGLFWTPGEAERLGRELMLKSSVAIGPRPGWNWRAIDVTRFLETVPAEVGRRLKSTTKTPDDGGAAIALTAVECLAQVFGEVPFIRDLRSRVIDFVGLKADAE